ncbi:hypothetical protein [Nonomuraea sp. NPDC003804]|uniref:hypothetical protein n=1 Tax=Nonomuraea sp. NPDC003804 TaxID=3154547 RepID=UPI0033A915C4
MSTHSHALAPGDRRGAAAITHRNISGTQSRESQRSVIFARPPPSNGCHPGDTLIIYKSDRIARSVKELLISLEDDAEGTQALVCDGHTIDARNRLTGGRIEPL